MDWRIQTAAMEESSTYVNDINVCMELDEALSQIEEFCPQTLEIRNDCAFVYVDTETTGFGDAAQIIQLSAKYGEALFDVYMLPTENIDWRASDVTGLRKIEGKLYCHGKIVVTIPSMEAAEDFISFLKKVSSQVVLLAHNAIRFDAPKICTWLQTLGKMEEFCSVVYGFCDTLKLIGKGKLRDLALENLKGDHWKEVINGTHNAVTDCIILEALVDEMKKTPKEILDHTLRMPDFIEKRLRLRRRKLLIDYLLVMKSHGVSNALCGRIAEAGITMTELRKVYAENRRLGLQDCLQAPGKDNNPRVAFRKTDLDKMEKYFVSSEKKDNLSA